MLFPNILRRLRGNSRVDRSKTRQEEPEPREQIFAAGTVASEFEPDETDFPAAAMKVDRKHHDGNIPDALVAEGAQTADEGPADIGGLNLQPGTIENGVLVGRDRFLFLAGGAHAVFEIVTGTKGIDERSVRNFRDNIRGRSEWAAKRNIPYIHLVFPDKQSVVPELWPFGRCLRLGDLYLDGWRDAQACILYPVGLLREMQNQALSRVDTHVTPAGSIHVAADVAERLTATRHDDLVRQMLAGAEGRQRQFGDLGSKLSPPVSSLESIFSAPVPGRFLSNGIEGGHNGLVDLRFNPGAIHDRRCVFFGDSFGRDICLYLQFWFSEVFFFRTGFFHPDLAARCAPDVLVTENVERYLDDCVPDANAPDFFTYLDRKGVIYTPSTEFVDALSGILDPPATAADPNDDGEVAGPHPAIFPSASAPIASRPAPLDGETVIEAARLVPRTMPVFVIDQSATMPEFRLPDVQDIHGTLHAERKDVLLFGPSIQVSGDTWWCESRAFGEQFIDMVTSRGYETTFPGPKPRVSNIDGNRIIDFAPIIDDIEDLEERVFLATPLEPHNWGRWISTVVCKIEHFRRLGQDRRLLCVATLSWQRELLARLGVRNDELLPHDAGRTYRCRDLAGIEYNVTNMTVSAMERTRFQDFRSECSARVKADDGARKFGEKIFVSRLAVSNRNPHYRVLQNEQELVAALDDMGYDVIEPEQLSFDEQVAVFGNARSIVCLGGAAIYNAVFCDPHSSFLSIESSDAFLGPHTNLLSSLGLRYGIIVGTQDPEDPMPIHRRWTVDVRRSIETIKRFES